MLETKRLTVEFSAETMEVLESLKKRLRKTSYAEVIRLALQVLNYLEKQREQGYGIAITVRKTKSSQPTIVTEVEVLG